MTINQIAAVVVLYNPTLENLNQLIITSSIFNEVIVINNSPENQLIKDFENTINYPKNIILHNNPTNLGIAQALNYGIKSAQDKNYKWVVTLDQDSEFNYSTLETMIKFYNFNSNDLKVGIIAPLISNHGLLDNHDSNLEVELIEYCITSGNIINIEAWEEVKGFNEDFFIYHVDNEYCLKLKIKNYKILRVNNAVLEHEVGESASVAILGKTLLWDKHSPIANYYITRNSIYYIFELIRYKQFSEVLRIIKYHLIKENIKTVLFQNDRLIQLRYIIKGYIDFLFMKKGKIIIQK
jgi:rhamnosyltransferase